MKKAQETIPVGVALAILTVVEWARKRCVTVKIDGEHESAFKSSGSVTRKGKAV